MSNFTFAGVGVVFGALIAFAISSSMAASDAENGLLKLLSEPTQQQKIQMLCIQGNDNACRVYEARFGKRCIL